MHKIKTIILKEWAEVFKNRMVLFTVAFLPLLFLAIPQFSLQSLASMEASDTEMEEMIELARVCQQGADLTPMECAESYMLELFIVLFMILPVAIPVTIAAYSVVGEKTSKSLEPLLATPITTTQLLLGKGIAAITPAVVMTWLVYGVHVGISYFRVSPAAWGTLLDPLWLVAVFILGPLLTWMTVTIALMVSSRVSDPRVAEQLTSLVVVPIVLLMIGQTTGLFLLSRELILIAAIVIAVVDVILTYFCIQLFQRETILTRWN
ncbi:MAG TPA: ABC transporter permease subunit [Anaerolineae bacterium]|nr:ABC transporter permease subunit [Anaerolineae bacterium]